jgi:hypothetical protein
MKYPNSRWNLALLVAAASLAATPALAAGGGKSLGKDSGIVPATVEAIPGSDVKRVTLTERAAERIDLKTDEVREAQLGESMIKVVPYSSLIYDPHGGTWVYTETAPRSFVRAAVDVETIKGDNVFLKSGPPLGTVVASVGVAEIYGTEFEVGH